MANDAAFDQINDRFRDVASVICHALDISCCSETVNEWIELVRSRWIKLLNLSNDLPPGFSRFEDLVEVVSEDDAVRLPARERVKFYRDRGYEIQFRDLAKDPL